MNERKRYRVTLVSIALAVALILRTYPTIFHGAPWGTDGWPLFKDVQQLLGNSPTALGGNSAVFADQYNIYWPAVIVFGAISSLVFNSVPTEVMPLVVPIVAALSTLVLFALVEKVTGSTVAAFAGSILFTVSSFDSLFTASVTKETFAYPLFVTGILVTYLAMKEFSFKSLSLFVLVALGLEFSHYAIAVLFAALVVCLLIAKYVVSISRRRDAFDPRLILLPASLLLVMGPYLFYAWPGFELPVTATDVFSSSSFLAISITVALYFTFTRKIPFVMSAVILGAATVILAASAIVPLTAYEPIIPSGLVFDAVPYLAVGVLALIGHALSHGSLEKNEFSFLAVWLAVPLGLFGYSIFGTSGGLDLVYRLFSFIYMPTAVFGGLGLAHLFARENLVLPSKNLVVLKRGFGIVLIFGIGLLCASQSYYAVVQGQNLLGGQWGYSPSDTSSAKWISATLPKNTTINGDSKFLYLYEEYYGLSVDTAKGYQILIQGISNLSGSPLVTDRIMGQDGYNIELYGNPIPSNWMITLGQHNRLVYTNGNEQIWD